VEIGAGKWDGDIHELFFKDNHYNYKGIAKVLARNSQTKLQWSINVFALNNLVKESASAFIYSSPSKDLSSVLHSTILQMGGNIYSALSQVVYKSKLVLSLKIDGTIDGWACFESSAQEPTFIGHIVEGRWDNNGRVAFSIRFTQENVPSDYIHAFNLSGVISHDEVLNHPTFTSVVMKVKSEDMPQNVGKKSSTPLSGLQRLEYPIVHEVSIKWQDLHPKSLELFKMPRSVLHIIISLSYSLCCRFKV